MSVTAIVQVAVGLEQFWLLGFPASGAPGSVQA